MVLRDRRPVGRVYLLLRTTPTRNVWKWFKQTVPGRQGEAPTLDAALEALRAAVLVPVANELAGDLQSARSTEGEN